MARVTKEQGDLIDKIVLETWSGSSIKEIIKIVEKEIGVSQTKDAISARRKRLGLSPKFHKEKSNKFTKVQINQIFRVLKDNHRVNNDKIAEILEDTYDIKLSRYSIYRYKKRLKDPEYRKIFIDESKAIEWSKEISRKVYKKSLPIFGLPKYEKVG